MPNRLTHVATSGLTGALFALVKSNREPEAARVYEVFGGILGGYAGGRAPDVLDPPKSPGHRGRAHSFVIAGTGIRVCKKDVERWQQSCRRWAENFASKRMAATPGAATAVLFALAEAICRILAGFIAGFLAGYVTHLALDACTPSCLALI